MCVCVFFPVLPDLKEKDGFITVHLNRRGFFPLYSCCSDPGVGGILALHFFVKSSFMTSSDPLNDDRTAGSLEVQLGS